MRRASLICSYNGYSEIKGPLLFLLKKASFLKVYIEFVTVLLLLFMSGFLAIEACGILAGLPGMEPSLPVLEGEVLTTGPSGN